MSVSMPPHAPYAVEVGHEVEVRVYEHSEQEGVLVAECEIEGDTFGATTSLSGSDLEQKLAVDELVQGIALLVWNELLGTPVFREEDARWVERVEARALWEQMPRTPTQGWVVGARVYQDIPDLPVQSEPPAGPRHDPVGDADVSELRLSQDEMAALVRGEIPEALVEKLLAARSTENLLESVAGVLVASSQGSEDLARARRELAEVCRRFGL